MTENVTPKAPRGWYPPFLASLRRSANVKLACRAAKISRKVAYEARSLDPAFAADWQDALDDAIDELERIAFDRAKKTSDTLMIFLLKSHRPAVYRETIHQEHTGLDGGPIEYIEIAGPDGTPPESWDSAEPSPGTDSGTDQ